jgi:hypothetical protein
MNNQTVTAEYLQELQLKISKARKSFTKLMNEHEKLEKEIELLKNTIQLDYLFERNGCKYNEKSSSDIKRDAELKEILSQHAQYQEKTLELDKYKRDKRKSADELSDLETELKVALNIFEDNRHKANRAALQGLNEQQGSNHAENLKALTVETLKESVSNSFYADLGI